MSNIYKLKTLKNKNTKMQFALIKCNKIKYIIEN